MNEIRETRIEEFDDLMTFLSRVYKYDEIDWFVRHYPHLYQRHAENLKNNFIIKDNGKIVSHVGFFPMEVLVGKSVFKAGGIGGVGTDPDYRRQGLMGKLLKFLTAKMEREGYAFSVLWGDRQRYGNFGWELGGRRLLIRVTERSLAWKGVKEDDIRRYDGKPEDLERIISMHEAERLKVKRTRDVYRLVMERAGNAVWLGKESYMVLSGGEKIQNAIESGGNSESILSLALSLIKNKELECITFSRPYEDSDINRTLLDASSGWWVEMLGSIKIINFPRTLEGFKEDMRGRGRDRDKLRWPANEKDLVRKMALPDDNLFNFYIWGLDCV